MLHNAALSMALMQDLKMLWSLIELAGALVDLHQWHEGSKEFD